MKYENCVLINSWFDWIINRIVLPLASGLLCSQILSLLLPHLFAPRIDVTLAGVWFVTLCTAVCTRNTLCKKNTGGHLSILVATPLFLILVFAPTQQPSLVFVYTEMSSALLLVAHFGVNVLKQKDQHNYRRA